MQVVLAESEEQVASHAADIVENYISGSTNPVLGLATGGSVARLYEELIRRFRLGHLSFASTRAFLLDEYYGLAPQHHQSYARYISDSFASLVDIDSNDVAGFDGLAADPEDECRRYEAAIAAVGGIGLQLVGIGSNGHIAFNEPGSSLASPCRPKTLSDKTRRDNSRFFDSIDEVPKLVLTQGVGTILRAERVLLVAQGPTKTEPLARAIEGPVTAMCPASALQLHPRVTIIVDPQAAGALEFADGYAERHAHMRDDKTSTRRAVSIGASGDASRGGHRASLENA